MKHTTKESVVYLLQAEGTKYFKIGVTTDLENRLKGIQTGNHCRILVVKTWAASGVVEKKAHQRFAEYQAIGEWFDFTDMNLAELLREIDEMCAPKITTSRLTDGGELILGTMNDLYSLELSAALLQAVEAGMLAPVESTPTRLRFDLNICPIHQMMMLPVCPMCIE